MKYLLPLMLMLCLSLPLRAYAEGPDRVEGTVVSVDEVTRTVTLKDAATGEERTFVVSHKDELKKVRAGDQVYVTPDKDNINKADKLKTK